MVSITLHGFTSPNPPKIRLALEELGLDYEWRFVDLYKRANETEEFRALSPRGTVPVLEIDGVVLWDSGAALLHLANREGRLMPSDPADAATALNLLFMEANLFQEPAGVYFFNKVIYPMMGRGPNLERKAKADNKLAVVLPILESVLGDSDYLFGDEPTIVDLAFGPWLQYLDLDDRPLLKGWFERLRGRPSWAVCYPDA